MSTVQPKFGVLWHHSSVSIIISLRLQTEILTPTAPLFQPVQRFRLKYIQRSGLIAKLENMTHPSIHLIFKGSKMRHLASILDPSLLSSLLFQNAAAYLKYKRITGAPIIDLISWPNLV